MTEKRLKLSRRTALLLLPLGLASCEKITELFSTADKHLPGVREDVLPVHNGLAVDATPGTSFSLPHPVANAEWLQPGNSADHVLGSLIGPANFKKQWQSDLGLGDGYRRKLVVQPLVFGGRVFTMDADAVVRAFTIKDGDQKWRFDPAPDDSDSTNVGGGLSSDGQTLFISTGYGDLFALDPATAKQIWRTPLGAPARSNATIVDGVLYLITIDARLLALSAKNGSLIWSYQGRSASTAALAEAAPAVEGDFVTAAFSSGQLVALDKQTGTEIWTDSLSTSRSLLVASDIAAVPSPTIISDGKVFALGLDNLMLSVDIKSGRRAWDRDIGGFQMPCMAGGVIFVYADGHLLALSRDEGAALWVVPIPQFKNLQKQKDPIVWYGPMLVNNKLWLAGDNGHMLVIDPANGKIDLTYKLSESFALPPVVADGVFYVVFESGAIAAFA